MAGLGLAAVPESASTAGEPIRDLGKPASNVVAYGTACRYERCPEEACPMARRLDEVVVIPNIAAGLELTDGAPSWRHCPAWLTFFFQLGQRVAAAHEEGTKTCAVVIPPVRSFAALFSATGAVVGVATTARAIPDIDTHFSSLASLKPGTPLVVKMGEKIYAARFSGATERSGASYIKIEYKGMIQFLPKQECHRAQVGSGGKRSLPKSVRPSRGGSIRVVEALLGDEAGEFLSVPTVDAVLVGHVTLLTQELESVQIRPEGEPAAAARSVRCCGRAGSCRTAGYLVACSCRTACPSSSFRSLTRHTSRCSMARGPSPVTARNSASQAGLPSSTGARPPSARGSTSRTRSSQSAEAQRRTLAALRFRQARSCKHSSVRGEVRGHCARRRLLLSSAKCWLSMACGGTPRLGGVLRGRAQPLAIGEATGR